MIAAADFAVELLDDDTVVVEDEEPVQVVDADGGGGTGDAAGFVADRRREVGLESRSQLLAVSTSQFWKLLGAGRHGLRRLLDD